MCTRILSNAHQPVTVSRTMDWPDTTMPILTILPAGMPRHGGRIGPHDALSGEAATWTSRFGSVVTTMYGVGTADGMNERGLAAHMLYLEGTDFGERDDSRPGLLASMWVQYLLDNAETVADALSLLEGVQLVMMEAEGHQATVHLAIEDAHGDSAIVEYPSGVRRVHHDREFTILTNEPSYDEQIRMLQARDFSNPSDDVPIDGNVNPIARFQRAAYFLTVLPEPRDSREAVAGVLAIARNVSIPFGAPYEGFGLYSTEYRTVCDLTNKRYFFELSTCPSVVWVDLENIDFSAGAATLLLDPNDIGLAGEVSQKFAAGLAPF